MVLGEWCGRILMYMLMSRKTSVAESRVGGER